MFKFFEVLLKNLSYQKPKIELIKLLQSVARSFVKDINIIMNYTGSSHSFHFETKT